MLPWIRVLSIVIVAFTWSDGVAQKKKQAKRVDIKTAGKVKNFGRGVLLLENEKNDEVYVAAERGGNFSFVGNADASWLRPGMIVKFTSRFKTNGQAESPVGQLAVVTLDKDTKLGAKAKVRLGRKGLFSTEPTEQKARRKKKRPVGPTLDVVGRITKIRAGKIQIATGRVVVQIQLTQDARINVDVADPRWIQLGDAVSVEGWHLPGNDKRIMARKMIVKAAKPLTGNKRKPKRSKTTRRKKETRAKADQGKSKPSTS